MTDQEDEDLLEQHIEDFLDNWQAYAELVTLAMLWIWAFRMRPEASQLRPDEIEYLQFIAALLAIIALTLLFILVRTQADGQGGDDE